MLTSPSVAELSEARGEIAGMITAWVADGSPAPLAFMARFSRKAAEVLRRAGQTDEWIRREIFAVLSDVIMTYPESTRATFLEAVERRLAEALPPLAPAPAPESTTPGAEDGQAKFDRWVEESASPEESPILTLIHNVKGFARDLRSIGRSGESIRAQAAEVLKGLQTPMNPRDRERLDLLVTIAIEEVLTGP